MSGNLALLDDPQWALFIAGQLQNSHGCIATHHDVSAAHANLLHPLLAKRAWKV